jgi:hypothetical protein
MILDMAIATPLNPFLMTNVILGGANRRCVYWNTDISLQPHIPAVAIGSSEGLLETRGLSGGALWEAEAFMRSAGSMWRFLLGGQR